MAEGFFAVAPTDVDSEHNLLRRPLQPFAIWQLDDSHFAFDSSVLLPSMTAELAELIELIRANPGSLLSIFGHTDTTGNDEYNKILSGRRSMALYALLTRRVDLWEFLFNHPHGGDDWRREHDFALALMREATGDTSHSLPRAALFDRFMSLLSRDADGKSFGLPKTAFLGKGLDPKGKADFQGCSEFNPLIMFSEAESKEFRRPERKADRDEAGAPNRRVTVFLFPGDTKVTPTKWPCPRALEATAGCRHRFWSDQAIRRTFQEKHREHLKGEETFACRFYERLEREAVKQSEPVRVVIDDALLGTLANTEVTVTGAVGRSKVAKTNGSGVLTLSRNLGAHADVAFAHSEIPRTRRIFLELDPPNVAAGAWQRLVNLGYIGGAEPPREPPEGAALTVALEEFQGDHGLEVTGSLDPETQVRLGHAHEVDPTEWRRRDWGREPTIGPNPRTPKANAS